MDTTSTTTTTTTSINTSNEVIENKEVEQPTLEVEKKVVEDSKEEKEIIRDKKGNASEAPIKAEYLLPIEPIVKNDNQKRPHQEKQPRKLKKQRKLDPNEIKICVEFQQSGKCNYGDKCKFSHDLEKFIASKPKSLGKCYLFDTYGYCKYGIKCLYGEDHIKGIESIRDEEKINQIEQLSKQQHTINEIDGDITTKLRKKQLNYPKSQQYFKDNNIQQRSQSNNNNNNNKNNKEKKEVEVVEEKKEEIKEIEEVKETKEIKEIETIKIFKQSMEGTEIEKEIKLRNCEKKRINFKDQLYLAPLTTVGNLPFRRICKGLGVDITCGEMALSNNIVQGHKSELALLKRHSSEDKFGVQVCGSQLDTMIQTAEFIDTYLDVDFVDINSGCPIDMICKMGAGAAMMERTKRMETLCRGMSSVMDAPLTIKIRIGKTEDQPNAHKIIPSLQEWGATAVTLHGRSRAQRYTRLANWEYIRSCAEVSPIPLIGNGDIYNWRDIEKAQDSKISSLMVARGALVKPWIFTEIKERRDWDISSSERLDLIKNFVNYGLDHWGSDKQGVDNTRHFLLNWLSFTHRYVPVGLLEIPYSKISERPPGYFGRNDMETLMASSKVSDWIKISELYLGPVEQGYDFTPKHNSNSYESQG